MGFLRLLRLQSSTFRTTSTEGSRYEHLIDDADRLEVLRDYSLFTLLGKLEVLDLDANGFDVFFQIIAFEDEVFDAVRVLGFGDD